ncbi:coiled-coil domain-containing protein [Apis mellifera caucasica]|uniref:Coiled-coil domain-containing protein 102A n=1 Tax=Apis mellifera TaxID=7460 RepID=A0A7M7IFN6_APIME|nr:coiled-coil domain-containing protein 102A [Apis mellifera]XP_396257.3 coiled-coil domain-containing protein 102A [Apis mellifera]KAG6799525.1 coiled-coil domain-containing protein [Apis mellifera caucasica]KAG9434425.1 coiled-coil domain-containing protein [Apis mellifera carnica]|eukprot:XP_016768559.1 coiled-coil domain-containing protein 102A [Apis mellifera]
MAQSTTSGTSSRRYMREHDVNVPSSSRYVDSEWETKEALRQRELEEARARAAQMEKTMRWWSDCTANWREKWSKVRNERNMAREEAKMLRAKLEIAVKDANSYKHECQELELQNEQLKKEMEKIHMVLLKHAGQFDQQIFTVLESDPQLRNTLDINELLKFYNNVEQSESVNSQKDLLSCKVSLDESNVCLGSHNILPDRDIEEYVLQGAVPKHAVEIYKDSSLYSLDKDIVRLVDSNSTENNLEKNQSSLQTCTDESYVQKILLLQHKLDEAAKTISTEREEKNSLHHGMEKLKAEIMQLRKQCEELEESKAEITRELLELKDRFQIEFSDVQAGIIDEASSREGMNRRLCELRAELERLQAENAAEWGKRERLETEKISLERENKQLRNELNDLQERIESRRSRPVSTSDNDARQLQQEFLVRNVTILKKSLEEKTTELSHAMRRSEQYEAEVKRVRARVEELKKELAAVQDEVDAATNSVRKLQRANEDLLEQLESANVQLEHFRNNTDSYTVGVGTGETLEEKLYTTNNGKLTNEFEQA